MDHRISAFDAHLDTNGGAGPIYVVRDADGSPIAAKWRRPASRNRLSNLRENVLVYHVGGSTSVAMFAKGKCLGTGAQHGSVTLYPCDAEFDFVRGGACEVLHLYLAPERVDRYAEENLPGPIAVHFDPLLAVRDSWLQGYFAMLLSEFELYGGIDEGAHAPLLAQSLEMVIRHLVHWHSDARRQSRRAEAAAARAHPLNPSRLKTVVDYIDANLGSAIDLAALAALAGQSTNHFIRSFGAATRRSPYAYVTERRLALVVDALRRSEAPLAEIARAAGFRSPSTLTNTFKRRHGLTPSAYRARLR
jgi:AraC family transcriptional regulator